MLTNAKLIPLLVWYEIKGYAHYPMEAFAGIISVVVGFVTFLIFWVAVAHYGSGNVDVQRIVSYFLITNGLGVLMMYNLKMSSMLSDLVRTGGLNQILIKPISPALYVYALSRGDAALFFSTSLLTMVIGIIVRPAGGTIEPLKLIVALLSGLAISTSLNFMIATFSFYTNGGKDIKNTVLHGIRFLRGDLIPFYLLQTTARSILTLLPFAATAFVPASLIQGQSISWTVILAHVVSSFAFVMAARAFWKIGIKRYEAVGI